MADRASVGSRKSSLAGSTGQSSRSGSHQASASGGVVGLPSAVDDSPNPSQCCEDVNYEAFEDLAAYNSAEPYMAPDLVNNSPTNGFQDGSMNQNSFNLSRDSGLRISIPDGTNTVAPQSQPHQVPNHSEHDSVEGLVNQFDAIPENGRCNTQPPDYTTGLAAIPGGQEFSPEPPFELLSYPDPSVALSQGSCFGYPVTLHNLHAEDIPIDPQLLDTNRNPQLEELETDRNAHRPINEDNTTTQITNKRNRSERDPDSESEDEAPPTKRTNKGKYAARDLDSESEDENEAPVKRKPIQAQLGSSRRDSNVSDSSSLGKHAQVKVIRPGEKPKKVQDKSWIRINTTTRGETTRTARINQFSDGGKVYKIKPLPVGDWEVEGGYRFDYVTNDGMDEFAKRPMTAKKVHEYIAQYPGDNLRIWIQVTPGDSARRYASKSHNECIFKACPNRVWATKGTIEVGSYRVAFDEKHKKYGKGAVDPFDCVGFAHLYCMERFLDFAGICMYADVKVDTRNDMMKEPKGEPAFAFSKKHVPERILAEKFVKAAKLGRLRETPEFSNYPVHAAYERDSKKPHEQTLTAAMFNANWEHRPVSQVKQFVSRTVKPSSCGIHRGDQEIIVADKMIESMKAYKKAKGAKQHKNFDYSVYYDKIDPQINIRIAECTALRAHFEQQDALGLTSKRKTKQQKPQLIMLAESDDDKVPTSITSTRNKSHGKRKRASSEESNDEDESEFFYDDDDLEEPQTMSSPPRRLKSRSSPRKKPRINYAEFEPQDLSLEDQNPDTFFAQSDTADVQSSPVSPKTRRPSTSTVSPKTRNLSTCSDLIEDVGDEYAMPDGIDLSGFPTRTASQIDEAFELKRRKSSTVGPKVSIMKSPKLARNLRSPQTNRTASFDAQPVTSSKEYNVNDPPRRVAGHHCRRHSSTRLASK